MRWQISKCRKEECKIEKCKSYHTRTKTVYRRFQPVIDYVPEEIEVGECYGTKECEECNCGGDPSKCSFYPEIRKRAEEDEKRIVDDFLSSIKPPPLVDIRGNPKRETNTQFIHIGLHDPENNLRAVSQCSNCKKTIEKKLYDKNTHTYGITIFEECPICGCKFKKHEVY